MAQALEKNVFAVTWSIENFSMCPQKKDEWIESPEFVVDALEETAWSLRVYPKGHPRSDANHLSCYLHRFNKEHEPEEVTIDYNITLITSNTKSVKGCTKDPPQKIKKGHGHGYPNFALLKTLSDDENTYTPNDVFTVLCCMRLGTQSSENPSDTVNIPVSLLTNTYSMENICTRISDYSISEKMNIERCFLNTRIPVERRVITWVIKDFDTQMLCDKKIPLSVMSKFRENSQLTLFCYVSGDWDNDAKVRIDIEGKDKKLNQMFMRCKVSLLGKNEVTMESRAAKHLFEDNYEVWSFPSIVKLGTIYNRQSELLDGDALTLQCEFLMSYKGEEATIDGNSLQNNLIDTDGLKQDIKDLLDNEELTDVTLKAEGWELPVHKTLICARSPVFRKMFINDTEEKRTGVVRITDIDVDTLNNMRDFIYEDRIRDLEYEDVKRLYSAADKYQILTLKKQCVDSLKFKLSTSNICDVLILADLHQDADLLKHIHSFLCFHTEVFHSREWMDLMKINLELAGETMRKLLEKKTIS